MLRDDSRRKVYRCGRRIGKTETMCVEAIYQTTVHRDFVFIFCVPFENQCRLIHQRITEIIENSPLVKNKVTRSTRNPYQIFFSNNSRILCFTTGSSSGSSGASIRGQKADMLALDELDYMGEGDFATISVIAAEKPSIRMVCSSTPTGKRGDFYKICTDKSIGYSEHYHPSSHIPSWNADLEQEFKSQLTAHAYMLEIEACFGDELSGVFDKKCIDRAITFDNYAYDPLTSSQLHMLEKSGGELPTMYLPINNRFKPNLFRVMGVDWDKFQASSSIVIMDFDEAFGKFRITRRIEVPKTEYSYDNAVNMIVELNDIYNPSWIYVDRGAGEYQIERLHQLGEQNPASGLKNKVKGWQFANKIDVPDPVTKEIHSEPMKPFMVNQLALWLERDRLIMSPYDNVLYKQLIDYSIERITQNGIPVYTSKNEHFIDATALCVLAFTLEFPLITQTVKRIENATKLVHIPAGFGAQKAQLDIMAMAQSAQKNDPWKNRKDLDDLPGDRPTHFKVPIGKKSRKNSGSALGWGNRTATRFDGNPRELW